MANLDGREMWQLSHLTKSKNGKKMSHVNKRNVFCEKLGVRVTLNPCRKCKSAFADEIPVKVHVRLKNWFSKSPDNHHPYLETFFPNRKLQQQTLHDDSNLKLWLTGRNEPHESRNYAMSKRQDGCVRSIRDLVVRRNNHDEHQTGHCFYSTRRSESL
jgi:hypothetical protein